MGLRAVLAAVLLASMWTLQHLPGAVDVFEPALLSVGYGFLLLEAYLVGDIFARVKLPRISGYIAAGVLCGPFVFGFVDTELAGRMKLIDELALTFIAVTAGAELKIAALRERKKAIGFIIVSLVVVVASGMTALTMALREVLPFVRGEPFPSVVAMGALIGVIAVARSPTSAIAIIRDCRAKGPYTDTVFGVTVAMDSLVILLFALVVAVAEALVHTGAGVDLRFLGLVLLGLTVSVGIGLALGTVVAFYIRRVKKELVVFLVILAFLITETSRWVSVTLHAALGFDFHLEPLLIAMTVGFTVQNFTREGSRLLEGLHAISLPIFVVFFSMAGVGLNLDRLAAFWLAAVAFAGGRMIFVTTAAYAGCAAAGLPRRFRRFCGLGFFTQAGVSLGLTQELVRRFPEWGPGLGTFLVGVITLNEIVGPVALKFGLDRMGESGRAEEA